MPLVEKRYAEALLELSARENAIDRYQQELSLMVEAFEKSPDIRGLLLTPGIGTSMKKGILTDIFRGKVSDEIFHLLLLLMDKKRIHFLPGILEEYGKLADRARKVLEMTIISAALLEQEQLDKIKEGYRLKHEASSVRAAFRVDGGVIGGVMVKAGDKVTDGTVRGRLENLRKYLLEN